MINIMARVICVYNNRTTFKSMKILKSHYAVWRRDCAIRTFNKAEYLGKQRSYKNSTKDVLIGLLNVIIKTLDKISLHNNFKKRKRPSTKLNATSAHIKNFPFRRFYRLYFWLFGL